MARNTRPTDRSELARSLGSPWLTAGLALVVVLLAVAALVLPNLIGLPGSSLARQSPTPAPTPTQTAGPTGPTAEPTFTRPTPSPEPAFTTYVVRSGDTLTSIATRYRTTARSIAWWNRGTYPSLDPESAGYRPNSIRPGWVLVLMPGVTVDDANPPTPSPPLTGQGPGATPLATPAATAAPTTAPNPAPTTAAAGPATVISHGPRDSTAIALTFDMGGRLDPAVDIVQWLVDHHVHATLFPTGSAGSTTTLGREALTLAAAHPELFDIGNHSWSHPDFTTLTATQMADQVKRCETAIAPITGQTSKPWFRPPYGAWTSAVRAAVGQAGYRYLVMWDVDTIDWRATIDGGPTATDIVTKITAKAQAGSIVLMHLGGWHTLEALPGILAAVQAKGLQPVTLGEMFGA
jgi:peptidoglycan/xylan/chitin deacetylase (PgdA/CDA1 family)